MKPQYVVECDRPLSAEERHQVRQSAERILAEEAVPVLPDGVHICRIDLPDGIEARARFLNLDPQEQGFLAALAADGLKSDVALVYADWLEEQGREKGAGRVRQALERVEAARACLEFGDIELVPALDVAATVSHILTLLSSERDGAAEQRELAVTAAVSTERERCAGIVEKVAEAGGPPAGQFLRRLADKIREGG